MISKMRRPAPFMVSLAIALAAAAVRAQEPSWPRAAPALPRAAPAGTQGHAASRRLRLVLPCRPTILDPNALVRALLVELAQEGVASVEAGSADPPADGPDPSATIEVQPSVCDDAARAFTFSLRVGGRQAIVGRVDLGDVPPGERSRVVALALAERIRESWAAVGEGDAGSTVLVAPTPAAPQAAGPAPAATELAPVRAAASAPAAAVPPAAASSLVPAAAPSAVPRAPAARDRLRRRGIQEEGRAPPALGVERRARERPISASQTSSGQDPGAQVLVHAAIETRFFQSYGGLVGPRIGVWTPVLGRLRVSLDGGAAFGSVRDPLGEVVLTVASGAAALMLVGAAGPVTLEVGPRLELGWAHARGTDSAPGVRSSSASALLATASAAAVAWTSLSSTWRVFVEAQAGITLAGLDARADQRSVFDLGGALIGATVGAGYAF